MTDMLKIVHAGDIHAGRPLSIELDKERGYVRRREIEISLWRICEFAKDEKAQIILLSGDLFEHVYARPAWVKDVSLLFATIPEIRVFISPGNHDPVLSDSLYRSVKWSENVTIFASDIVRRICLDDIGVDVYGLGWLSFTERRRLLQGFRVERSDRFNIALVHGDLTENSIYLPISAKDIENSGVDYFALGHYHAPMVKDMEGTRVVYPGCPEPLDFGDKGERGVYMVTVGNSVSKHPFDITTEFVPLASRMVREEELDLTGVDTGEKIRNAILSVGSQDIRRRDMWQLLLTGRVDPDLPLELDVLERELRDNFFHLRLVPMFVPDYDLAQLLDCENQTLEARFVKALKKLEKEAIESGNEEMARVANLATYYGLDALRQGEIVTRRRMA
jgi:DNA repair exonuclease SbcCD nuclease subunit